MKDKLITIILLLVMVTSFGSLFTYDLTTVAEFKIIKKEEPWITPGKSSTPEKRYILTTVYKDGSIHYAKDMSKSSYDKYQVGDTIRLQVHKEDIGEEIPRQFGISPNRMLLIFALSFFMFFYQAIFNFEKL